jgi:hypothetical protein
MVIPEFIRTGIAVAKICDSSMASYYYYYYAAHVIMKWDYS